MNYTIKVETVDDITGDFVTCNLCGVKILAPGTGDGYFIGAQHMRLYHSL